MSINIFILCTNLPPDMTSRNILQKILSCWILNHQLLAYSFVPAGAEGRAGGGGEEDSTSPPPPSPGASRRAPEARRKRCSCGKCSRCVPSPSGELSHMTQTDTCTHAFQFVSLHVCVCVCVCVCVYCSSDWVWNGSKYVQVSTRDWKMVNLSLTTCTS